MSKNAKTILIGWISTGMPATNGESMKNQLLAARLEELGVNCMQMDFKHWKRHPQVFLKLVWTLLRHPRATVIFSSTPGNVIGMMRLFRRLRLRRNTVHWAIGGHLADPTLEERFCIADLGYMRHTLVECQAGVDNLRRLGVEGVSRVVNFKPIDFIPDLSRRKPGAGTAENPLRMVFLSSIAREKGCAMILEAVARLNREGYGDRFKVDFYGAPLPDYRDEFLSKVGSLRNARYAGFLNLRQQQGYETLAAYDLALFPTYYAGECCAGIFADMSIAGVPMLLSDWHFNNEYIHEGETGIFIPANDTDALTDRMRRAIEGEYDLAAMSRNCQLHAADFDVKQIVNDQLLQQLQILQVDNNI